MSVLTLGRDQVRKLLPMATCMDLMAGALRSLASAQAVNPLRWGMRLPNGAGLLGMMPAAMTDPPVFGLKIVSVFPGNHAAGRETHLGAILLFEQEFGQPVAIVDAAEITAIRTAAVSGVATRLLAREDAGDLAIIGTGVQARSHLAAMRTAREIRRVRVFSPTKHKRRAFALEESERSGLAIESAESAEAAVVGADIVCTVTASREPVVRGDWLAAGAHVNAVGACVPAARELDGQAMARARIFTDSRESETNESGDLLLAQRDGDIPADHHVAELGEVLNGDEPGRTSDSEITLFDSLGLAVEDLAAAHYVVEQARAQGIGTPVELA